MHIIHGPANVREGAAHNDVENTTLTVTLLSAEHLGWI